MIGEVAVGVRKAVSRLPQSFAGARPNFAPASGVRRQPERLSGDAALVRALELRGDLECGHGSQFESGVSPLPRQPPHSMTQASADLVRRSLKSMPRFFLMIPRIPLKNICNKFRHSRRSKKTNIPWLGPSIIPWPVPCPKTAIGSQGNTISVE